LIVGLCTLVLVLQATAAAMQEEAIGATQKNTTRTATTTTGALSTASLERHLATTIGAAQRHRGTVRFFERRPWLLRSERQGRWARAALRRAERRVARTTQRIAVIRRTLAQREARRLAKLPPKAAICAVFRRYCGQALAVAWCESRFDTSAQNGQYLGLFQMGYSERRLFGHGPTAHAQSRAAHRYFVRSGRDWSPWGCKPWYRE
jgi:hypothetical protein